MCYTSLDMPSARLRVGVSELSPLVMKRDGAIVGFEVDLWEAIADRLGVVSAYEWHAFPALLQKTSKGQIDVGFAGISKTEARERMMDFTHASFRGGLSILVRTRGGGRLVPALRSLFTRRKEALRSALFMIFVFIFCVSHLLWFIERGAGAFDAVYARGIQDAAWYTIVTMSTVGYGDFVPKTLLGRGIGTLTILIGYAVFALFIAELNTVLLMERTHGLVHAPEDLRRRKVATVRKTVSETLLQKYQATVISVPSFEEAVLRLRRGEVEAVVFDAPVVQHYVREQGSSDVHIVGPRFEEHDYAFVVPEGSPWHEKINRTLLQLMEDGTYDRLYRRWFGA